MIMMMIMTHLLYVQSVTVQALNTDVHVYNRLMATKMSVICC